AVMVRRLRPTLKGIVSVILNRGASAFFVTTASALMAKVTSDRETGTAFAAALAMAVGVSCSDLTFTIVGSGGRRVLGERGLRWIRTALAVALALIGVAFIVEGTRG